MGAVQRALKAQSPSSAFLNDECLDIIHSGRDKSPVSLPKCERTEANSLSVDLKISYRIATMAAEQSLRLYSLSSEKAELNAR